MPTDTAPNDETSERKIVLTLTGDAAKSTRRLAAELDVTPPEVVRRGLGLLQFLTDLKPNEELVIRDTKKGDLERIRFQWNLAG